MMEVVEVESSSSLEIIPVLSSQCRTVEVQSAGSSPGSIPGTGDMRRDLEVSTSDTRRGHDLSYRARAKNETLPKK